MNIVWKCFCTIAEERLYSPGTGKQCIEISFIQVRIQYAAAEIARRAVLHSTSILMIIPLQRSRAKKHIIQKSKVYNFYANNMMNSCQ